MTPPLKAISSKATAAVLAEWVNTGAHEVRSTLRIESVGGVEAARRVKQGERFDLVFLAADPLDRLIAAGHLRGPRMDLMRSTMVVAGRSGAARIDIDIETEESLRQAVLAARRIGYSTGPSGDHVLRLLERWGFEGGHAVVAVQAPPGVSVGQLLDSGEVALGFQQRSELLHHPGVDVIGCLPQPVDLVTVFSVALGLKEVHAEASKAWLEYFTSPAAAAVLQRHGMEPA